MVRAILDGRKTQTRRVITKQPPSVETVRQLSGSGYHYAQPDSMHDHWYVCGPVWAVEQAMNHNNCRLDCPYGQPGDRLWVRETWAPYDDDVVPEKDLSGIGYRADEKWNGHSSPFRSWNAEYNGTWKPSIFMPRWASRITLELTAVRVQRVQEISEEDAMAEGIELMNVTREDSHRFHYRVLWDDLNLKRGFGWKTNPWVWALTFKRV